MTEINCRHKFKHEHQVSEFESLSVAFIRFVREGTGGFFTFVTYNLSLLLMRIVAKYCDKVKGIIEYFQESPILWNKVN